MKKLLSLTALIAVGGISGNAMADTTCQASAWSVKAARNGTNLDLEVKEVGTRGPGCNLVVKNLNYIEGIKVLSVDVAPVTMCPLESYIERSADISWQLPFNLRGNSKLQLIVNGAAIGQLVLSRSGIVLEGGCQ